MAVLRLAKPIDFCIDFFFLFFISEEKKNLHSTQGLWTVFSVRQVNKLCDYLILVAVEGAAVRTGKYRMEGGEA